MKAKFFTFLLVITSLGALAQGKVNFANDSTRTLVFSSATLLADAAYANQPVPTGTLPSGLTLQATLYAGTSAASLSLQTTFPLTGANMSSAGLMAGHNVILVGIAGGVVQYFQIFVWGTYFGSAPSTISSASDFVFAANPYYYGASSLFTAVPGASISYPPLYQNGSPVNSTWASGDFVVYGAPEPSSLALVGMGAVVLMFHRRHLSNPP